MTNEAPQKHRRCKKSHLIYGENAMLDGRCRRCKRRSDNRSAAIRKSLPLCPRGHGLVPSAVTVSGGCAECTDAPPPPPDDWLDWAAVIQTINGRRPVRPLTKYETLCTIITVARRNDWSRAMAADWLRMNAWLAVPEDDGQYLELEWAPRKGLPLVSANEAIARELTPDLLLADYFGELAQDGTPLPDVVVFGSDPDELVA